VPVPLGAAQYAAVSKLSTGEVAAAFPQSACRGHAKALRRKA
jgi:hypothetical protein